MTEDLEKRNSRAVRAGKSRRASSALEDRIVELEKTVADIERRIERIVPKTRPTVTSPAFVESRSRPEEFLSSREADLPDGRRGTVYVTADGKKIFVEERP